MKNNSHKIGEVVGEIAAASQEQARGISQLNTGIAELDRTTQQNAAGAEESASASEEMHGQAVQMQAVVETLATMLGNNRNGNGNGHHRKVDLSEFTPMCAVDASWIASRDTRTPRQSAIRELPDENRDRELLTDF